MPFCEAKRNFRRQSLIKKDPKRVLKRPTSGGTTVPVCLRERSDRRRGPKGPEGEKNPHYFEEITGVYPLF